LNVLVAGSSGFYGSILIKHLLSIGINCLGVDIQKSEVLDDDKQFICDLCNYDELVIKSKYYKIDAIIHLATQIDFAVKRQSDLYENNVNATTNLARLGKERKIKSFIFTSSNSIFLGLNKTYILDDDKPMPIDMYGKSKVDSEVLLSDYKKHFNVIILRCPNIIDSGRVGMMSILFELVKANAVLWIIGSGEIRHQCLYAKDLNLAVEKLLVLPKSETYNIGSENVPTFREMFKHLILVSGSKSRILSVPSFVAINSLKILHKLGVSPMGPYQFRMLTIGFEFDLKKIKNDLNWKPTTSNTQMIEIAYKFYTENSESLRAKKNATSAPVKMGILSLLKFIKL